MQRSFSTNGLLTFALVLVLGLTLNASGAAWAEGMGGGCPMMGGGQGMGGGHGMGGKGCMMRLDPQKAGQVFDLKEKFMQDTAALRKEMMIKRAEMGALWRTADPDTAKIQAKQKEINALRDQLQEKGIALHKEMRKLCPAGAGGPMACSIPGAGGGMPACTPGGGAGAGK